MVVKVIELHTYLDSLALRLITVTGGFRKASSPILSVRSKLHCLQQLS